MISVLRKQANIELKRQIGLLQIQHSDKNYSIEELEQLLESNFEDFSNDFNTLATQSQIDIKLIKNPTDDQKFSIIENEEELYKASQKEFTHALREDEFIPTRGKREDEINLFISYSHKDQDDVDLFIKELEKAPYPFVIWKDNNQLISGENFKGNIQKAIADCDFGLLMVSENFESEFILEYELPHFLEMPNSEVSKTKPSVPLFINNKDNALQKLNFINNDSHIFSYRGRGFIEAHDRNEFVRGLVDEIFNAVGKQEKTENKVIEDLQNSDEAKDVKDNFIPTKAELGVDIVKEIKEWSNVSVSSVEDKIKELKDELDDIESSIIANSKLLKDALDTEEKLKSKKLKLDNRKITLLKKAINDYQIKLDELYSVKQMLEGKWKQLDTKKNRSRYFALLGDSGMGKTWSCMKIALELQEEETTLKSIYLDLRHFAASDAIKKEFDWKEIIEIVVRKSLSSFKKDMSVDTIFDIIKRGKAFVIFDGLDEVTVHLEDDRSANAFIRELKNVVLLNQNNKILFSCRTHYFRTIQEQFSMLSGQDRERVQNKDFMSLELLPFTWKQIEEYCNKNDIDFIIFKNVVTNIHNLEEISQRPYSLKLITLQIRELEERIRQGLEVNSADIYLGIIESSLNRDSGKHTLSKVHKPLIMQELSAFMWRKSTRVLEYHKLDEWFTQWLYDNPPIAEEYRNDSREKLKSDLRGATFMVRPNTNVFRFSHTSLQEFFLAQYLFKGLDDDILDRFNMQIPSTETMEFIIMLWKRHTEEKKINNNFNQLILINPLFAFELYLISNKLELELEITNSFKLEDLDFSNRKISGSSNYPLNIFKSTFINVKLHQIDLSYVNFKDIHFINTSFYESNLENCNFENIEFERSMMAPKSKNETTFNNIKYDKYSTVFGVNG